MGDIILPSRKTTHLEDPCRAMELVPTPLLNPSAVMGKSFGKGEEQRNITTPLCEPMGSSQLKYRMHLGFSFNLKEFNRCGRATVGIGMQHGFQTWKSRNPQSSWKRCSWWGTGERITRLQVALGGGEGSTIHRCETGSINWN